MTVDEDLRAIREKYQSKKKGEGKPHTSPSVHDIGLATDLMWDNYRKLNSAVGLVGPQMNQQQAIDFLRGVELAGQDKLKALEVCGLYDGGNPDDVCVEAVEEASDLIRDTISAEFLERLK